MRHQKKTYVNNSIETLKNELADRRVSVKDFFSQYFSRLSEKTYQEFCIQINTDEVVDYPLKLAMAVFFDE